MNTSLPANCRPCPLCEGRAVGFDFPYLTVWNGEEFHYVRCGSCGCTFVHRVPTDEEFAKMYSRENYHDTHYAEVNLEGKYKVAAERLRDNAGGRKTVLDFGCGNGAFILAAKRAGFDCQGIEFHPSAIESAKKNTGVNVATFEEMREKKARFDVIHLGDVFEHLPNQAKTIKELEELLAPRGVFYVEGPLQANASFVYYVSKGFKQVRRKIGKDVPGSSPPTHLILVNREAQERFFVKRMGYRELMFHVYEDGWPYKPAHPVRVTPGTMFKRAIAEGSIAASKVRIGGEPLVGNRFASIFEV